VAPTVGRVDANLAYLLRTALLGDVVQDQIPELEVIVDGIEFELAILKADSPGSLLPSGVESIEIGLSECHTGSFCTISTGDSLTASTG